jgi:ribosome-binding protein aMBF1 (putative translation factor)
MANYYDLSADLHKALKENHNTSNAFEAGYTDPALQLQAKLASAMYIIQQELGEERAASVWENVITHNV